MKRRLGVAVIGPRGVGAVHARAIEHIPYAELRAVVGATSESSRHHAHRLGVAPQLLTVEDVCASDHIDAVHICTPNNLHRAIAAAAMRAGKHVICEKPLADKSASAAQVVHIQNGLAGVHAFLCHPYRFLPLVGDLADLVSSTLGTIFGIRACYLQNWMLTQPEGWRLDPQQAGHSRVLLDIGTHLMDLVEYVSGAEATSAAAEFVSQDGGTDPATADQVSMLLRLSSGAVATLALSQISAASQNRIVLEVDGSQGSARWSYESQERLEAVMTGAVRPLALNGGAGFTIGGTFRESRAATPELHIVQMLTAMYDVISGRTAGKDPRLVDLDTGLRHHEVIDQACGADPVYSPVLPNDVVT